MKKIFSLLMSGLVAVSAFASTETLNFKANQNNVTTVVAGTSSSGSDYQLTQGDVTVSGTVGYYKGAGNPLQVYKTGTLTVTVPAGAAIESVTFSYASQCYPFAEALPEGGSATTKTGAAVDVVVTPSAASNTLTFTNAAGGQTKVNVMTVTYSYAATLGAMLTATTNSFEELVTLYGAASEPLQAKYANDITLIQEEIETVASALAINIENNTLDEEAYVTLKAAIEAIDAKIAAIREALAFVPAIENGDYFIRNVAAKEYMTGGSSWGTHIVVANSADYFTATLVDGVYNLDSHIANNATNHFVGDNDYLDSPAAAITIDKVGEAYTLKLANGKYYAAQENKEVTAVAEVTDAAKWEFLTLAQVKEEIAKGTAEAPTNATLLIRDANFGRNNQFVSSWVVAEGCTNKNLSGGNNTNNCAESWHSAFNISQEITEVPNGVYKLTAQGFWRQDGEDVENIPMFFINDKEVAFPVKEGTENSMGDASASFTEGKYTIDPITVVVTDGTIKLGVKNENLTIWAIWDNFQLQYCGEPQLASTDLTKEMFHRWSDPVNGQIVDQAPWCDYVLNESTGMPYGNGNVDEYEYADLSNCVKLVITTSAGTPRALFNRDVANGQAPDHLIDCGNNADQRAAYMTEDNGVFTIDLAKIVADKGYAHLHTIKGAQWANVTVTSMKIFAVSEENFPTAIETISAAETAVESKVMLVNGKIMIVKNGQVYNAAGMLVK